MLGRCSWTPILTAQAAVYLTCLLPNVASAWLLQVSFKVDDGPTIKRKAVIDPVVNGRLTGKVYYTGGWGCVDLLGPCRRI